MDFERPARKQLLYMCYPHIFCPDNKDRIPNPRTQSIHRKTSSNYLSKSNLNSILSPKSSHTNLHKVDPRHMLSTSQDGRHTAAAYHFGQPRPASHANNDIRIDTSISANIQYRIDGGMSTGKSDRFNMTATAKHFRVKRRSLDVSYGKSIHMLDATKSIDRGQECLVQRRSRYSKLYVANDK